ncbi:K(+)-transporting ATPase subunit C [Brevibacterium sp. 5221]|uniref:Potassium-transporting ATPase KdpC subunit n=1 Tax=Brevibacterium rongguiense TaxID=2695267 RepID=A0A6N9H964_9MICO|nr:K(+)-transporting ATPase subunit C [Brevibacterium rongguiense]MYM20588.1 K(+)-transporting ATPase subunit C [Brevibacterium rongguiense]
MHTALRGTLRSLWTSAKALAALSLILGLAYPLAIWCIGRLDPAAADGSPLTDAAGRTVGSTRIGQPMHSPELFSPRPSAAGDDGWDAMSSGASNLANDSAELREQIAARRASAAQANGADPAQVPPDALTASGSGLDPDISPAYARLQADRVARANHVDRARIDALIAANTQHPALGFLGEKRVNVVTLNAAVRALHA